MGLSLQRDDTLHLLYFIEVWLRVVAWRELLYHWSLSEGYVVSVCREYLVRVLLRGLLNHLEERRLLLHSVDDECAAEYLVTAVL